MSEVRAGARTTFYSCGTPTPPHHMLHTREARAGDAQLVTRPLCEQRFACADPGALRARRPRFMTVAFVYRRSVAFTLEPRSASSAHRPESRRLAGSATRRLPSAWPARRCHAAHALARAAKRRLNHSLRAPSGCRRNQFQACSTSSVRTRRLPALPMPCSISLLPLAYGAA